MSCRPPELDRPAFRLLAAGVLAALWVGLGTPVASQDTAELATVARCVRTAGSCALDPWYRPPLPLLLAALFPDPAHGVLAVSLVGMAAWLMPAIGLARRLGGSGLGLPVAVLLAPIVQQQALAAHGRGLGTALAFGAVALGAGGRPFAAGLVAAAAAMSRTELLAALPLVLGVAALAAPGDVGLRVRLRPLAPAVAGMALGLAPLLALTTLWTGRPQLVPRGWELAAAVWLEAVPFHLLHLAVGPTSFRTPLREALMEAGLRGGGLPALELAAAARALPAAVPAPLLALCGMGLVRSMRKRAPAQRATVLGLVGLAAISVFSAALPQGAVQRVDLLLPTTLAALVLADVALAPPGRRRALATAWKAGGAALLATVVHLSFPARTPLAPERTPATEAARGWLLAHPDLSVRAIDANWASFPPGARRLDLGDPTAGGPVYLLLSPLDDPWLVLGLLVPRGASLRLEGAWTSDEGWAAVVRADPAPRP